MHATPASTVGERTGVVPASAPVIEPEAPPRPAPPAEPPPWEGRPGPVRDVAGELGTAVARRIAGAGRWVAGSSLVAVLPMFIAWRVWLQVAYWLAYAVPRPRPSIPAPMYAQWMTELPGWLIRWMAWDGNHNLRTAILGYGDPASGYGFRTAIFPLYPMTIRWLSDLTGLDPARMGLIVSHVCALIFLVFLYRLGELVAGKGRGRRTVLLFLALPTSFFLAAYYNEAMLLALAAICVDAALRKRWALAVLAAALASATKPHGIVLAPFLVLLWLQIDRRPSTGPWLVFAPAGLIAYSAWLNERFGDPLAWLHAQASWNREVSGNFVAQAIRSTSEALAVHPWGRSELPDLLNLAMLAIMLVLAVLLLFDRQPALAALVFGVLLMPVSTGSLLSLSRLGLLAFPALLWLARHTRDRGGIEVAWLVAGFGVGSICLAIFIQGGFVA